MHKHDANSTPICQLFRSLALALFLFHHRFHGGITCRNRSLSGCSSVQIALSIRPLSILSRLDFIPNAEWKSVSNCKSINIVSFQIFVTPFAPHVFMKKSFLAIEISISPRFIHLKSILLCDYTSSDFIRYLIIVFT